MIPALMPKKMSSVIIARMKPKGEMEPMHEEGEHEPGLMSAAEDLISAIHAKDAKAVASALKSAQDILDIDEPMEDSE